LSKQHGALTDVAEQRRVFLSPRHHRRVGDLAAIGAGFSSLPAPRVANDVIVHHHHCRGHLPREWPRGYAALRGGTTATPPGPSTAAHRRHGMACQPPPPPPPRPRSCGRNDGRRHGCCLLPRPCARRARLRRPRRWSRLRQPKRCEQRGRRRERSRLTISTLATRRPYARRSQAGVSRRHIEVAPSRPQQSSRPLDRFHLASPTIVSLPSFATTHYAPPTMSSIRRLDSDADSMLVPVCGGGSGACGDRQRGAVLRLATYLTCADKQMSLPRAHDCDRRPS
jgi:hypothetical protein